MEKITNDYLLGLVENEGGLYELAIHGLLKEPEDAKVARLWTIYDTKVSEIVELEDQIMALLENE